MERSAPPPSLRAALERIAEALELVERALRDQLASPQDLIGTIGEYVLSSGGKRLRPALLFFSAELCGYTGPRRVQVAAAAELLHTASLLHDDVGHLSLLGLLRSADGTIGHRTDRDARASPSSAPAARPLAAARRAVARPGPPAGLQATQPLVRRLRGRGGRPPPNLPTDDGAGLATDHRPGLPTDGAAAGRARAQGHGVSLLVWRHRESHVRRYVATQLERPFHSPYDLVGPLRERGVDSVHV